MQSVRSRIAMTPFASPALLITRRAYVPHYAGSGSGPTKFDTMSNTTSSLNTGDALPSAVVNALKTAFIDFPNKKCSLCGDNHIAVPKAHVGYMCHRARIGVLEKALSGSFGVMPMDLPKKTWSNLNSQLRVPGSTSSEEGYLTFQRLPFLSASTQTDRRSRICYLIEFLADRGVLKNSLNLTGFAGIQRDKEFETFEMVGDNAIKYIFQDRLFAMFNASVSGGGTNASLSALINLLDSNEGLRTIFDYLSLERIIGVHLPNSKLKSDVVESMFGELQVKIWASEISHDGCEVFSALKAPEHRYLIALMRHLLSELGHVLLQWAVEETMLRAKTFVDEHLQSLAITRRLQEASTALLQQSSLRIMSPPLAMLRKVNTNMRPVASSNETASLVKDTAVRLSPNSSQTPSSLLTPLRSVASRSAFRRSVLDAIDQLKAAANLQHVVDQQSPGRRQRFHAPPPQIILRRRDVGKKLLSLPGHFKSVDCQRLFTTVANPVLSHPTSLLSSKLEPHPHRPPVAQTPPDGSLLDILVHRTLASGEFVRDLPVGRSRAANAMGSD